MLTLLKKEKGFTLIELMVVVLIIAILVAIAVPVFNVARTSAQRRTCQANLRTLDGAVQTYNADQDFFPSSIGDLDPDYIKQAPICPAGTAAYTFAGGGTTQPTITCPNNGVGGVTGHSYP